MSFTKKNTEINETNSEPTGLLSKVMPFVPLLLEQFTGQSMNMSGTIGDILTCLQRIETKINDLERNCSEQFIEQAEQLNSLQKISKLVITKTEQAVHFTNAPKITELKE